MAVLANQNYQSHHPQNYTLAANAPQKISSARAGRTLICQVIGSGSVIIGAGTTGPDGTPIANNVSNGYGTTLSNPTIVTDSATTSDWYAAAVSGTIGTVQLNVDEIY